MRRFLKLVAELALYTIVVFGAILLIPKALAWALKTEYPLAVVTSGSMWPTFKSGDLVLVQGIDGDVLGVSDIAVYKHENGFAIHRVVEKNANDFVTKGDANSKEDPSVGYDQLVGKAVEIGGKPLRIPWVGAIGNLLRKYL